MKLSILTLATLSALCIGAAIRSNVAATTPTPTQPHVLCCIPVPQCDPSVPDCPIMNPPSNSVAKK